jgi:NitT/TauT family transport system ATP-binding protein
MAETTPILELRQVTQEYGPAKHPFVAVQDVTLSLRDGEFLALLGPSGCGKSTLLRIATGLQKATRGDVLYRGEAVRDVNPKAAIVFQTFALFPWLTIQQNVEVALRPRGMDAATAAQRAVQALDRAGLDGFESAYPRELSGGMRQKAGFVRALAVEPELLCLDEPFSALDVLSADSLRGELLDLWTSGTLPTRAVLMVTHNIEEAVLLADRIAVMEKRPGRMIADFAVDLPRPRSRKDPRFLAFVDRVYGLLAGQTQAEAMELGTAPGEPGRTRALPNVNVDALMGLLEHLLERPEQKEDIYRLAEDLHLDSDHLLGLTDAGELLGFVDVRSGDAQLKAEGTAFAREDIDGRKRIFRERLERVPLLAWLLRMLRASNSREVERDVAEAALAIDFTAEEARKQMEIAIRWGRYAEMLGYDDARGVLFLEADPTGSGQGRQG